MVPKSRGSRTCKRNGHHTHLWRLVHSACVDNLEGTTAFRAQTSSEGSVSDSSGFVLAVLWLQFLPRRLSVSGIWLPCVTQVMSSNIGHDHVSTHSYGLITFLSHTMNTSDHSNHVPATVPSGGRAVAESLSMAAISVITACLCAW